MTRNVFVVGSDAFNKSKLRALPHIDDIVFHDLFTFDRVQGPHRYSMEHILNRATERLRSFPQRIDGILGYWDLPVSALVALLGERIGVPAPPLRGVMACEHKYWSRVVQRSAISESVPAFCAVDPFANGAVPKVDLPYPFWIKPVKSFQSHLGFRVNDAVDLERAIVAIREGIGRMAEPFKYMLDRVVVPPEVGGVSGYHCVAEQLVDGRQCTAEGYVFNGEATVYGIIDSIRYPDVSSFARYEYPSLLPPMVQQRIRDTAERVVPALGLTHGAFNIEFFWDEATDHLWLIEVNPRISQSHAELFEKVDGVSHHQVALDLALGMRPQWVTGRGPFRCAAKCFVRVFEDGLVTRVPDAADVRRVEQRFPGTVIQLTVRPGQRLSQLPDEDSYSFCLALIYHGAESREQLLERQEQVVEALPFEIDRQPVTPMQPAG